MKIEDMEVGKVYSFTMMAPVIYGARIEKAQLCAKADINVAKLIAPVEQQYAQVYPTLPTGAPYTPTTCNYYIFKQMNGEQIAIADQWIVQGSVEEIARVVFNVKIYDGALGDLPKIKAALAAIGKHEVTVESA